MAEHSPTLLLLVSFMCLPPFRIISHAASHESGDPDTATQERRRSLDHCLLQAPSPRHAHAVASGASKSTEDGNMQAASQQDAGQGRPQSSGEGLVSSASLTDGVAATPRDSILIDQLSLLGLDAHGCIGDAHGCVGDAGSTMRGSCDASMQVVPGVHGLPVSLSEDEGSREASVDCGINQSDHTQVQQASRQPHVHMPQLQLPGQSSGQEHAHMQQQHGSHEQGLALQSHAPSMGPAGPTHAHADKAADDDGDDDDRVHLASAGASIAASPLVTESELQRLDTLLALHRLSSPLAASYSVPAAHTGMPAVKPHHHHHHLHHYSSTTAAHYGLSPRAVHSFSMGHHRHQHDQQVQHQHHWPHADSAHSSPKRRSFDAGSTPIVAGASHSPRAQLGQTHLRHSFEAGPLPYGQVPQPGSSIDQGLPGHIVAAALRRPSSTAGSFTFGSQAARSQVAAMALRPSTAAARVVLAQRGVTGAVPNVMAEEYPDLQVGFYTSLGIRLCLWMRIRGCICCAFGGVHVLRNLRMELGKWDAWHGGCAPKPVSDSDKACRQCLIAGHHPTPGLHDHAQLHAEIYPQTIHIITLAHRCSQYSGMNACLFKPLRLLLHAGCCLPPLHLLKQHGQHRRHTPTTLTQEQAAQLWLHQHAA